MISSRPGPLLAATCWCARKNDSGDRYAVPSLTRPSRLSIGGRHAATFELGLHC